MWPWLIRRLIRSIAQRDPWTLGLVLTELRGSLSALRAYQESQKIAIQQTRN
jgi:hypothetical protein